LEKDRDRADKDREKRDGEEAAPKRRKLIRLSKEEPNPVPASINPARRVDTVVKSEIDRLDQDRDRRRDDKDKSKEKMKRDKKR